MTTTMTTTQPDAFDLDTVTSVTEAGLPIVHPLTGKPTGAVLVLAGPEHPLRRRAAFEQSRRLRAQLQAAGDQDLSMEQLHELDTELLVAATLGWQGLRRGGRELPYSPEACRSLYVDPQLTWLRAQVKDAQDRRALFIKASGAA